MIDVRRRARPWFLRLVSVPVWWLLAVGVPSPASAQPRASPDSGLPLGLTPLSGAWDSPAPALSLSPGAAPDAASDLPATWWRGWRDHFALRLRGIEYRDEFVFHRQHLRLRISGPVVKGSPGLRVELRGWAWRGTTTRVSAYGSAKRQGFRFEIAF